MGNTNTGSSTGILPNGQAYGQSLEALNDDGYCIGGGELYTMNIGSLTAIPDDSIIEVPANNAGTCSGGFKVNYKPKLEQIINQFNQIVKSYITRETITCKTGIVSWNIENLSRLSTGTYIESGNTKRVVFTGKGELSTVLIRLVHEEEGKTIRFTMVGQGGKGFGLEFGEKPLTVDAEFEAINKFKNFLAEFRETTTTQKITTGGNA